VLANCFPELKIIVPDKPKYATHYGYWKEISNQRNFLNSISKKFNIENIEDWKFVSTELVKKMGGSGFLRYFNGSLLKALQKLHPEHNWTIPRTNNPRGTSKGQHLLHKIVQKTFPDQFVLYNMNFRDYDRHEKPPIKLDIVIPDLSIAIEYHAIHHFEKTEIFGDILKQQQRDSNKQQICNNFGLSIVVIPYWWEKTEADLMQRIRQVRPDI